MHSNVISLSKLPALTGTHICIHMITSRAAAALQTVYHVDRVPDRLLMRFCKKMQLCEMTELIPTIPQKHESDVCVRPVCVIRSDAPCNLTLVPHWLPCCTDDTVHIWTFMSF